MPLVLDQLLGDLKKKTEEFIRPHSPPALVCLTFAELRQLALQPNQTAPELIRHLGDCQSCARLAMRCAMELPHLPWWVLLRVGKNQLTAEEEQIVRLHLLEGGCTLCLARQQQLRERLPELILLPVWLAGTVALAAPAERFQLIHIPGLEGAYQAELRVESSRFQCEVRTQDQSLINTLFTFTCYSDRPQGEVRVSYTVLSKDLHGWYSGQFVLEPFREPREAGFAGAYLLTLRPDQLNLEEVNQLLTVVGPLLQDPTARQRWRTWLARNERDLEASRLPAMQRLVSGLKSRLAQWLPQN